MFAWIATVATVTVMATILIWLIYDAIKAHLEFKALRLKFIKHDIAAARRPGFIHPGHRKDVHDEDWH